MKHKIFVFAALMVLMFAVMPVFPFDPPDPLDPPCVLYIDPQKLTIPGPCIESTTFEAEVRLYEVRNLYAWDMAVWWDTDFLNLTDHTLKVPPGWGPTDYEVLEDKLDSGASWERLHFIVTYKGEYPEGLGFNGSFALANLFFHVIEEPCFDLSVPSIDTLIQFSTVTYPPKMSTGCGDPIVCEIDEPSVITLVPGQPNMEVLFSDEYPIDKTKKVAQGWFEKQVITAYVWVSNVTKLYDIHFILYWDTALLDLDIQQIHINEEAFPMPWESLHQEVVHNVSETLDYIFFYIKRPHTKIPLKGDFWILQIDFKVKCVVDDDGVPINATTPIWFDRDCSFISTCCADGEDGYYCVGNGLILSDADYYWTPIPNDFDQNGHVGVEDIQAIMKKYGPGPSTWSRDEDDDVDIYDIVIVSKDFCNSDHPVLAEP